MCCMPPARTKIGSIPDIPWSRVKLPVWFPTFFFLLNLCCKCPNGSCKPILDIYTSIAFQWYKKLLNARCFDLYNHFLKVRNSTRTQLPSWELTWECESSSSHSLTLLLARTLVSLCLGRKPKAKVATTKLLNHYK